MQGACATYHKIGALLGLSTLARCPQPTDTIMRIQATITAVEVAPLREGGSCSVAGANRLSGHKREITGSTDLRGNFGQIKL